MTTMNAATIASGPQQTRAAGGIGASDAAACIGLNPYQSPLDKWLQMTGRNAPFAGNEATFWGQALESVIRAHYVERNRVVVHVPPTSLWHPTIPWLKAMPDGVVIDEATGKWLYVAPQVKSVGLRVADRWDEGPPEEYVIQAVIEMAVTDLDRLDFAVLIGAQRYEQFTVHRDQDLEASVLESLGAFWQLVETDTQPAIDGGAGMRTYLFGKLKKLAKRATIGATEEDLGMITRWREVVIEQTKLKREEREIKNRVLAALSAADAGKITSEVGAISLGNPRKKTAWKAVAEAGRAFASTIELVERELLGLRGDAADGDGVLLQRIDALRAQLRLIAPTSFAALIEANTSVGDPVLNRPRAWTKDLLDDSDGDDE